MNAFSHATARLCQSTVTRAMAHLTTAGGMARWNLGMADCREAQPGLFTGTSRFDGATAWVRVSPVAGLTAVDYHVGASPEHLLPRIHARVVDGGQLGHGAGSCVVTLLAWRPADMSDDRWARLMATHETEIELIRAQLNAKAL